MCGINGIFGFKGIDDVRGVTQRMNDKMRHRGPNSVGAFSDDEQISLGHVRLSIIDLEDHSNQPFRSADGRYTLVFNGEIYNYLEIKEQLDYPFKTGGDTEVVLAAYQQWGEDCCKAFNGMFAFAIWDNLKKELFIARDRMGIKPLYFYNSPNNFVFASEIRALIQCPIVPKRLDTTSLVDYLRYQTVQTPNTILEDVQMLPSGSFIKLSEDDLQTGKYWSEVENHSKKAERQSREEIKDEVQTLLRDSVKRRMMSDVPYGAFLSGGIDSSAIVGLMSEISPNRVKTFSVTFQEEEFSEAKYARMVANKFGTDHQEIKLTPEDFLKDLPNALTAMDHPSGDGPNTYIVSKATKDAGVTMALSGLGGDELFAGYDIFTRSIELYKKRWLMSFPKIFRQTFGYSLKTLRPSIASNKIYEILRADKLHFEFTYPIARQVLLDNQIIGLLNHSTLPENAVFNTVDGLVGEDSKGITMPLLSKVSMAEINTYMQNVLLRDTDQMSMASALEVRVPFLDHTLLEYVLGIPDDHKYPNYPKQLLVESLGDLLPKEIVHREKMGFVLPWSNWMKSELKEFCKSRLDALANRVEFNASELEGLWKSFENGDKSVTWSRLWYMVVLENWLEENNIDS